MKEKFISNNSSNNIVVQCACIGHCSYMEFYKYENHLKVLITASTRKKKDAKKLAKLESMFTLNKQQINDFIASLSDIHITKLDTYIAQDYINQYGNDLYMQLEYLQPLDKESKHDLVTLEFYTSYKEYSKDKSCFDITLTRNMVKELIKELNSMFNMEVSG